MSWQHVLIHPGLVSHFLVVHPTVLAVVGRFWGDHPTTFILVLVFLLLVDPLVL
jgi:hypothetical protein